METNNLQNPGLTKFDNIIKYIHDNEVSSLFSEKITTKLKNNLYLITNNNQEYIEIVYFGNLKEFSSKYVYTNHCMYAKINKHSLKHNVRKIWLESIQKETYCDQKNLALICFQKLKEFVDQFELNDFTVELLDASKFNKVDSFVSLIPQGYTFYTKYNFFPEDINIKLSKEERSVKFNEMMQKLFNTTRSSYGHSTNLLDEWPMYYSLVGKSSPLTSEFINTKIRCSYTIKANDLGTRNETKSFFQQLIPPDGINLSEFIDYRSVFKYENKYYVNCIISQTKLLYDCEIDKLEDLGKVTDSIIDENMLKLNERKYIKTKNYEIQFKKSKQVNLQDIISYNYYLNNIDSVIKTKKELSASLSLSLNKSTSNIQFDNLDISEKFLGFGIHVVKKILSTDDNILNLTQYEDEINSVQDLKNLIFPILSDSKIFGKITKPSFRISKQIFDKVRSNWLKDNESKDFMDLGLKDIIPKEKNVSGNTVFGDEITSTFLYLGSVINDKLLKVLLIPLEFLEEYSCPGKIYMCTTSSQFNLCVSHNMFPVAIGNGLDEQIKLYNILITNFGTKKLDDNVTLKSCFSERGKDLSEFVNEYNNLDKNLSLLKK
jgi:hypothetical protein